MAVQRDALQRARLQPVRGDDVGLVGEAGFFTGPVLVAYGAKLNSLVEAGQWWRLVAPIFVHVNMLHLLVNMYGLWIIGPYVEKLYGGSKFIVLWVLTGIVSMVASYLTVSPARPFGALLHYIGIVSAVGRSLRGRDGRLIEVDMDAATGKILQVEEEHDD